MERLHSVLDRGIPDTRSTVGMDRISAAEVDLAAGRAGRWTGPTTSAALRARALVLEERVAEARGVLDTIGPLDLHSSDTDLSGGQALASVIWAASRVGANIDLLEAATEALGRRSTGIVATAGIVGTDGAPQTGAGLLRQGNVVLGPVLLFDALLHATAGSVDHAVRSARDAVPVADARTPYWGAWARLELTRLLGGLLDTLAPDDVRAGTLAVEQRAALNAARLFFRSAGHEHMAQRCSDLDPPVDVEGLAVAGCGHMVRVGSHWQVGMGVQPPVHVAHSRGLDALDHLIANRHRSVPAVELASLLDGDDAWERIVTESADDPEEFALRIRDGRTRSRISKLLHRTVDGLGAHHRALAAHLDTRVQTGYVCRYDDATTRWRR